MPILEYPTHQRRLLPLLAASYALHITAGVMKHMFASRSKACAYVLCYKFRLSACQDPMERLQQIKEIHILSSGLKAVARYVCVCMLADSTLRCSWHMVNTLQECREACGGQGGSHWLCHAHACFQGSSLIIALAY